MYKGLCQNKKHGFDQYTKGGHFCAGHITLNCHFTYVLVWILVNYIYNIIMINAPGIQYKNEKEKGIL